MSIEDYLIEQDGKDWSTLISAWGWFLPFPFTIWLVNRFGDMVIVRDEGAVLFFDPGAGKLDQVASNRDEFTRLLDDPQKVDLWFMPPLVDHLTQSSMTLRVGQCYGYKIPPGLGGAYDISNFEVTDLDVHYTVLGQIFETIKDAPDGTKIKFRIKNSSSS